MGARCEYVAGDIGEYDTARRLAETCLSAYGRIDTLVNNAGINSRYRFEDLPLEEWDRKPSTCLKPLSKLLCGMARARAVLHQQVICEPGVQALYRGHMEPNLPKKSGKVVPAGNQVIWVSLRGTLPPHGPFQNLQKFLLMVLHILK